MTHAQSVFRVLFVCTGNTCRSPLAEAALRAALEPEADRVEVASAGLAAWDGEPASEGTRRIAEREGLDLGSHRARRLTAALARSADLVLVMEPGHRAGVEALGVDVPRLHLMHEWPAPGEPGLPVVDPFGGSAEAYEECWRRIRRHVERMVPRVRDAVRSRAG